MNVIEKLQLEHENIERELIELESIIQDDIINYSNLIHVMKKICEIWEKHELLEEKVFPILKNEKIVVPVKIILCEHKELKPHRDAIIHAISSGSDIKVKEALDNHGVIVIKKLREHINKEDEVLYRVILEEFSKEDLDALNILVNF